MIYLRILTLIRIRTIGLDWDWFRVKSVNGLASSEEK